MKIIIAGNALTSQMIKCSAVAQGISPTVYTYVEQIIEYTGKPLIPVCVGDIVRGSTSGTTAIVVSFGKQIRIKSSSGAWSSYEPLTFANKNGVRMVGLPKDDDGAYFCKEMEAKRALVTVCPKHSFKERGIAFISLDGSTPNHNSMVGHAIKDGDEVVLTDLEEIKKFRCLDYTAGSGAIVSITCFF